MSLLIIIYQFKWEFPANTVRRLKSTYLAIMHWLCAGRPLHELPCKKSGKGEALLSTQCWRKAAWHIQEHSAHSSHLLLTGQTV